MKIIVAAANENERTVQIRSIARCYVEADFDKLHG